METLAGNFQQSLSTVSVSDFDSYTLQPNKSYWTALTASAKFQEPDFRIFKNSVIELSNSNIVLSRSCLIPPMLSRFQTRLSNRKWVLQAAHSGVITRGHRYRSLTPFKTAGFILSLENAVSRQPWRRWYHLPSCQGKGAEGAKRCIQNLQNLHFGGVEFPLQSYPADYQKPNVQNQNVTS